MTTTKTKRPPAIPNTLKTAHEGDYFLILIPNHWARGETIEDAKRALTANSGRKASEWKAWRVYSVHPSTYVDEMGSMTRDGGTPAPVELAEHNPG